MTPKSDEGVATNLVQRYLDAMGGANNGHQIDWPERALIEQIALALRRARAGGVRRSATTRKRGSP